MRRYLVDTNHLGEALGRVSVVRDRIRQAHRQGAVFGTCGPVLCELFVGIALRRDVSNVVGRLKGLLQVVRTWPVDLTVGPRYAEVYHELRQRGRALSQVDMLVAAMARELNAVVLTADLDFQALPDIKTENWL